MMEALVERMLDGRILLDEAVSEFEKLYIQAALKRNSDHVSKTAAVLGIHRNTLSKRLTTYQEQERRTPKRAGPSLHVNLSRSL
ncbi:MAG: helix-turn-helix domain-containing protein [Acidobacteriota bacterium]